MFLVEFAVHSLVGQFGLEDDVPKLGTDAEANGAELVVMLHMVQFHVLEELAEVHGGVVGPVMDLVVDLVAH